MSKLRVGKKYRIQKDAMSEFGYELKCARRGAYILNPSTVVWFPNLTQSREEIDNRGFGNYEESGGDKIIEIAADDIRLNRVVRSARFQRIAFAKRIGREYEFYGLYEFCGVDRASRRVTWKRIASEIKTADYPAANVKEGV